MKDVRYIMMDVDGTLTDGSVIIDSEGLESKRFHISDGLGIRLAQEAGLEVVVLSGRKSAAVTKRMRELRVKRVYQGVANKAEVIAKLKADLEIVDEQIAFIGDDINDLPAFSQVGVKIAVGDGSPLLRDRADYVTRRPGGYGAVREAIEEILRAQETLGLAVQKYLTSLSNAQADAPGPVN
jgi:3-deoxy-D-manno-octulosonate 8-phosphate phosphatase (KDO 8-P phosphatase)